jgi:hypothetical protein
VEILETKAIVPNNLIYGQVSEVSSHGEASVPNFTPKIKDNRNLGITGQSLAMGSTRKSHDLDIKPLKSVNTPGPHTGIIS